MALMPDVTSLLLDHDLGAQRFNVKRRTGTWTGGRMIVSDTQIIQAIGIMQPPSPETLRTFPEGERREGIVAIYTQTLLHLSEGDDIADDVTWLGEQYKVIRVERWDQYGFCVAYAQKR